MKITTKITFKEYVRLLYRLAYEQPVLQFLVFLAAAILLWILFYYVGIFNLPEPVIYQYLTLALIVVVQPIAIYATILRNYKSSSHLRETMQIDMMPDEIKVKGESFYLEVKWDKMFKIVEKRNHFLIYQNTLSAIIIPKKDLGADGIQYLRAILKDVKNVRVKLKNS